MDDFNTSKCITSKSVTVVFKFFSRARLILRSEWVKALVGEDYMNIVSVVKQPQCISQLVYCILSHW